MNDLELASLQTSLSNLARVLYCLYLRPNMLDVNNQVRINNKAIISLLNSQKTIITKGRQISALLQELYDAGLIDIAHNVDFSKSLHQQTVTLPLTIRPQSLDNPQFHSQYKPMHLTWRPVTTIFEELCQLVGVIEKTYSADELGEYIAYWLGRIDTHCTEYQWTQKLVIHLKQRRQRLPLSQQKVAAGHQYVTPSAGIEFDDNVKQLISQYKNKS